MLRLEPEPQNRVARSGLLVFDLEALFDGAPITGIDLRDFLHMGLLLREREFRQALAAHDWNQYAGHHVHLYCSTAAIVPQWAYPLLCAHLAPYARSICLGSREELLRDYYVRALAQVDWAQYAGRKVVLRGCASPHVPASAYVEATQRLLAVCDKLLYGEPCSAVPLWRRPR
ncbi:MAG: DUF2480 family protein [Bacteroidetes bacterium]|nr:DUF2480 family protein [Bacteroidota bacterium]MDW8286101.1 DUF2480 family protein [Bacteroidota bacterium]